MSEGFHYNTDAKYHQKLSEKTRKSYINAAFELGYSKQVIKRLHEAISITQCDRILKDARNGKYEV